MRDWICISVFIADQLMDRRRFCDLIHGSEPVLARSNAPLAAEVPPPGWIGNTFAAMMEGRRLHQAGGCRCGQPR